MKWKRVEPTTVRQIGLRYKNQAVIKNFTDKDGKIHEFTTWGKEGSRSGAVIAITREGQVVTVHQFRAGPERWMHELPGGGFNDGEDKEAAAMRELKEETGYTSDNVIFLGTSCRDAYVNGIWHYYLATDCYLSDDGQELDEEEIAQGAEARLISVEQLIENAKSDQMTDPVAVLLAYDKLMKIKGEK